MRQPQPALAGNIEPRTSKEQEGLGGFQLATWFAVALALYVLSTGPAIKLARATQNNTLNNFLLVAYYPLGTLVDHSQVLGNFFDWYIGTLWKA